MVLSAVNRCRMMVFRDVVSRCEERGAKARRDDFEITNTFVPARTMFPAEAETG